jgi:hypothetical protein
MIAAAPQTVAPATIGSKQFKKTPVHRASEEALMRGSLYITISMV